MVIALKNKTLEVKELRNTPHRPRRWKDIVFLDENAVNGLENQAYPAEAFEDMDVSEAIQALVEALEAAIAEARLISPELAVEIFE